MDLILNKFQDLFTCSVLIQLPIFPLQNLQRPISTNLLAKMAITNNMEKRTCVAGTFACTLKGNCHALWQLYKKLEGVLASIEWSSFVIKTI